MATTLTNTANAMMRLLRSEGLMEWRVKADENDGFINRYHFWLKDPSAARDRMRSFLARFLLILACEHAVIRSGGSLRHPTGNDSCSTSSATIRAPTTAIRLPRA